MRLARICRKVMTQRQVYHKTWNNYTMSLSNFPRLEIFFQWITSIYFRTTMTHNHIWKVSCSQPQPHFESCKEKLSKHLYLPTSSLIRKILLLDGCGQPKIFLLCQMFQRQHGDLIAIPCWSFDFFFFPSISSLRGRQANHSCPRESMICGFILINGYHASTRYALFPKGKQKTNEILVK